MYVTLAAGEGELELDQLLLNSLVFQGGAGDVTIDLSGSTLTDLDIRMGAGSVDLDLTGSWQQNLSGKIKGGVGATTLYLPSNVGVRVQAQGGLGPINASGLSKNGDIYTNEAYGQSDVTLDIDIETGIGEITLLAR
jgi:predicted membrane protein